MKNLFFFASLIISTTAFGQILRPMDDLFVQSARDNAGKTGAQVIAESNANYDRFVALDVNAISTYRQSDAAKPTFISRENADLALRAAMDNDVVSLDKYSKYDKDNKGIGFCFGRAMFVNLYLAINGVSRANIKKAFVVGPMSKGAWGWHVTTIVQSKNTSGKEIWLAIDPVAGQIMEAKQWYRHWQGSSDNGKLRFYIAESGKFGAGPSRYDERGISNPFYNNYFTDMMKWFEKNDISDELPL